MTQTNNKIDEMARAMAIARLIWNHKEEFEMLYQKEFRKEQRRNNHGTKKTNNENRRENKQ